MARKTHFVTIYGDHNKVSFKSGHMSRGLILAAVALGAIAVLTVACCCPDKVADIAEKVIDALMNSRP